MRIFSYRNKRTLRRIALIALLAAVLLGLLILARISYLGRYVVYSPDGVYFDKTQKLQRTPQTVPDTSNAEEYPFETILSAASEETDVDPNAVQLQGFYIRPCWQTVWMRCGRRLRTQTATTPCSLTSKVRLETSIIRQISPIRRRPTQISTPVTH